MKKGAEGRDTTHEDHDVEHRLVRTVRHSNDDTMWFSRVHLSMRARLLRVRPRILYVYSLHLHNLAPAALASCT